MICYVKTVLSISIIKFDNVIDEGNYKEYIMLYFMDFSAFFCNYEHKLYILTGKHEKSEDMFVPSLCVTFFTGPERLHFDVFFIFYSRRFSFTNFYNNRSYSETI
jgi:hypothetical protein